MFKKNKLTIPLFILSAAFSSNALSMSKDIEIKSELYEVLLKENGEEIRFKTTTPKPQMTFEEETTLTNTSLVREFKDFEYKKSISKGLKFIDFKKKDNITAEYSSDGENYHKVLNKVKDKHIKVTVESIYPESTNVFQIRFTNSIFKGYND